MKRVGMATALTVVFALAAAAAVFLYVQSARQQAESGGDTVPVLVSTVDIPAGQALDPLIEQGVFKLRDVPSDVVVQGVIQDVSQLRGQRTAYPILANEEITAARLRGEFQAAGGPLGIRPHMQAWSVTLEPDRVVAGALQQGDHVEIFGTFDQAKGDGSLTRVLVPDARVLWTSAPPGSTETTTAAGGQITLTLEVSPEQAALLTYSQERGAIWMTLLPPNETGTDVRPVVSKGV